MPVEPCPAAAAAAAAAAISQVAFAALRCVFPVPQPYDSTTSPSFTARRGRLFTQSWFGRNLWGWADRWISGQPDFLRPAADDPLGRPDVATIRAGITSFDEDGETVVFEDGTKRQFDVIVFATGYRQRFPFLFPRPIGEQDGDGWVVGSCLGRLGRARSHCDRALSLPAGGRVQV